MSRCFPFPPPGYERKPRNDDAEPLIKDKHKEKKHKKEKRDKKKEGKEKKDKDASKDKHREKKDRKEKHKDRKKDRDKNKTDEKKIDGSSEASNRGKHGETSQQNVDTRDSKFAAEFSRRIGDEERGGRNQMAESFPANDQRLADGMCRTVKKENDNRIEEKKGNEKTIERQGIKSEERGAGSTLLPSFTGIDRKKVEGMALVENEKRGVGSTMLPSSIGMDRKRVEGMARPVEKDAGSKEKNKAKEGDEKQKNHHKEKNGEKKGKKHKHRDKEKVKIEEKVNLDRVREIPKDPINIINIKPLPIPMVVKPVGTDENHRKRKETLTNGFLHDNDVRPNKLPKPSISSHPFNGNGRKLEPCQTAIQSTASDIHGVNNTLKADSKEHNKTNGVVEVKPFSVKSRSSSFANLQQDGENGKPVIEPPHPDSKYLDKILSVPKMEDWSEFDDQEWLFNSNSLDESKKKKKKSKVVNETKTPQVWDKALRIESADVFALPYVIPY